MNNRAIAIGTAVATLVLGAWIIFLPTTEQEAQDSHVAEAHAERTVLSAAAQPDVDAVAQAFIPAEEKTSGIVVPDRETATSDIQSGDATNASGQDPYAGVVDPRVTPPSPPTEGNITDDYLDNTYTLAAEDQSSRDGIVALLNARLDAEPYDSNWASATEQALFNLFYDASPEGSQLDQASCRSTFCRIDVNHADAQAEQRFLAAFAASGQFTNDDKRGLYQRVVDHNGATRTVFFYARKGHELPAGSL